MGGLSHDIDIIESITPVANHSGMKGKMQREKETFVEV